MNNEKKIAELINAPSSSERITRFSLSDDATLYTTETLKPINDYIAKYDLASRSYGKTVRRGEYFGESLEAIFGNEIEGDYDYSVLTVIEDGFSIQFFKDTDQTTPVNTIEVTGLSV